MNTVLKTDKWEFEDFIIAESAIPLHTWPMLTCLCMLENAAYALRLHLRNRTFIVCTAFFTGMAYALFHEFVCAFNFLFSEMVIEPQI